MYNHTIYRNAISSVQGGRGGGGGGVEFPRGPMVCITLSFAYIEWVLCSVRNKTCSSCIMLTHHSLNGGVMDWTYRYIYIFKGWL